MDEDAMDAVQRDVEALKASNVKHNMALLNSLTGKHVPNIHAADFLKYVYIYIYISMYRYM